jgi:thioredoxin 1
MALYNITTRKEFEEMVLKSDKVVLVDFWAEWCPPCRAMAPILHDAAEEKDDLMDVIKVDIEDTDENRALAGEYDVRSIPNMPLFYGGKEMDRIIGLVTKGQLIGMANYVKQKSAN